jgi:hypothetical protein
MNFKVLFIIGLNLLLFTSIFVRGEETSYFSGNCKVLNLFLNQHKNIEFNNNEEYSIKLKNGVTSDLSLFASSTIIHECIQNNSKEVVKLAVDNVKFTQLVIDTLSSLTKLKELEIIYSNYSEQLNLNSLENLKVLKIADPENAYRKNPNSVHLTLNHYDLNFKKYPESLEELTINGAALSNSDFDEISKLKNLKTLNLINTDLSEIPVFVFSLNNLKNLNLQYNNIKRIPDELSSLKNLENLDLSNNSIDDEIPVALNSLSNLSYVSFKSNVDVKGKTLTNSSLKKCYYNNVSGDSTNYYSLCKIKDMSCFDDEEVKILRTCSISEIVNTNGKCGKNDGRCPDGECCSKYGYCGTGFRHCSVEEGCQSEFGHCAGEKSSKPTDKVSTNGKCGKDEGRCPDGECCSKYGYCGTGFRHCSVEEGCKSEFGKCSGSKSDESVESVESATEGVSTNGKCGGRDGRCPADECCSKFGYCGKTDKHCLVEEGCQSEFGKCIGKKSTNETCQATDANGKCVNEEENKCLPGDQSEQCLSDKSVETTDKISTNGKCGKVDGKCPDGECCSKYGYCGTGFRHCSLEEGCQSEFGQCSDRKSGNPTDTDKISTNGKCGKEDGRCPNGQCCSKYGYCGSSFRHCSLEEGCQSEFGHCVTNEVTDASSPTTIIISTNGKCGKEDGKCPNDGCCSKFGYCGTTDKHCSLKEGCQS